MKYNICRKSHGSDCHLRCLLRRSIAKAHRRLTFPAFSRQWLPTDISFFTANCKQLAVLPVTQQQKNPKKVMSAFHVIFVKGAELGRDKSWMRQAQDSVLHVCQRAELKQTKEWERCPNRFRVSMRFLPENLRKHCRELLAGKTQEIKLLVEENSKARSHSAR